MGSSRPAAAPADCQLCSPRKTVRSALKLSASGQPVPSLHFRSWAVHQNPLRLGSWIEKSRWVTKEYHSTPATWNGKPQAKLRGKTQNGCHKPPGRQAIQKLARLTVAVTVGKIPSLLEGREGGKWVDRGCGRARCTCCGCNHGCFAEGCKRVTSGSCCQPCCRHSAGGAGNHGSKLCKWVSRRGHCRRRCHHCHGGCWGGAAGAYAQPSKQVLWQGQRGARGSTPCRGSACYRCGALNLFIHLGKRPPALLCRQGAGSGGGRRSRNGAVGQGL